MSAGAVSVTVNGCDCDYTDANDCCEGITNDWACTNGYGTCERTHGLGNECSCDPVNVSANANDNALCLVGETETKNQIANATSSLRLELSELEVSK